jgi:predicted nucleotidyltransferase
MRHRKSEEEKQRIRAVLCDRPLQWEQIRFAYLFGSFLLKGSFEDIDIAVYVHPDALHDRDPLLLSFDIANDLERAVRLPVDVVLLNNASLGLQFEAARGEPIMVREWEECAGFAEKVTLRWWDTEGLRYAAML